MIQTKYTLKEFLKEFPNDDACLEYIFKKQFLHRRGYYRIRKRKCYCNSKGKTLYPLVGTIFENSQTSLHSWFYAIFLFSQAKNGVSAAELQRHLGVTYKCAWRMGMKIRSLMKQRGKLSNIVEVDEVYIGGRKMHGWGGRDKAVVMGMAERGGKLKAFHIPNRETHIILGQVQKNIRRGSHLMSDHFGAYRKTLRMGYQHDYVDHWKYEFARGPVHTASIEGFWSHLRGSLRGTYHQVSKKHLQKYVDEKVFSWNHRHGPSFLALLELL